MRQIAPIANAAEALPIRSRLWRRLALLVAVGFVGAFSVPAVRSARVFYYLQEANKYASDPQAALAPLEIARELSPDRHDVMYALAVCYRRIGRFDDSRDILTRLHNAGYREEDLNRQRLFEAIQIGHTDEPVVQDKLIGLLHEDLPDDVAEELYEAMVKGYLTQYRLTEAYRILDNWERWRVDEGQPKLARQPRLWMADLHARGMQIAESMQLYEKVIETDDECFEAHILLAQHLVQMNKVDEALVHLEKALTLPEIERRPDARLEVKMAIADAKYRSVAAGEGGATANMDEARSIAESVLDEPVASRLARNQARLLLAEILGEDPETLPRAIDLLERLVEDDRNHSVAHDRLSLALSRDGQAERARFHRDRHQLLQEQQQTMFSIQQQLLVDPGNIPNRFRVANILYDQGSVEEAASWYDTILKFAPDHLGSHRQLAVIYKDAGNLRMAETHEAEVERLEALAAEQEKTAPATGNEDPILDDTIRIVPAPAETEVDEQPKPAPESSTSSEPKP